MGLSHTKAGDEPRKHESAGQRADAAPSPTAMSGPLETGPMATVDLGFPRPAGLPGPRPGDVSGAPPSFHVLAKPTGAICNLDCSYCFFLSKEELYPGSEFRMSDDLLTLYLRQLLESHAGPEVTVAWQGGEPTMMGLDFFRRAVDLVTELVRPGQRVEHTMQTNGTLIDDQWAAFLAQHDFLVGISIDGPRDLHDAYRVDKGGKPTFDRVIRGLDRLKARGVRWNVLTTVHRANEDHGLGVYWFLRDDLGAEFVQLIPIVERPSPGGIPTGDQVTERSVSPAGYGRFLVEVSRSGCAATSGRCTCRCSTPLWRASRASPVRCASTARRAVRPWPWSTTGISTPATISSSPTTSWETSGSGTCLSSSPRRSRPSAT